MVHSVSDVFGKFIQTMKVEKRTCEIHGDYEASLIGLGDSRPACWSGCQECVEEKNRLQFEEDARARAIESARASLERKIGRASIPPRFALKTFEDYRAETKEQQRALKTCKDYADKFEQYLGEGKSILLLGGVGTGKTHLASSVANQIVRETKYTAVYSAASTIIRDVKATFDRESQRSESDVYRDYALPDLLIIDEVGVQNATEFELTVMFEVVNARYEAMIPTMVISNRGIGDLPKYLGDRVVDRLREGGGKMVPFDWGSERART